MKKITMDMILAELDQNRKTGRNFEITEEQKQVLISARSGQRVVSWPVIARLWEKWGWGRVSATGLKNIYERIQNTK